MLLLMRRKVRLHPVRVEAQASIQIFMDLRIFRLFPLVVWALSAMNYVAAQVPLPIPAAVPAVAADARSLNDWLMRMHEASKNRSYIGTFVISTGATLSSAKIWRVCEGGEQVERVETLTGTPRSVFRHNGQVVTFIPDHKVARIEKRDSLGLFPELLQSTDNRIADFYNVRQEGVSRVAGLDADVIVMTPNDGLRFGYRVWIERQSGLVVKLQTLDIDGLVLEQAAFSELQLGASIRMDKLVQMMGKTEGYRVEKPSLIRTSAKAEGWALKKPVAGFTSVSCYKRPVSASTGSGVTEEASLQWIFSDGLASVSIFVEPLDPRRHVGETTFSMGATRTLSRQVDLYWVTVMGEVPMPTLKLFASGLEHKK